MITDTSEKAAYVAPELVELGSFEEMTQASSAGGYTDIALAAGASIANHLQTS